MQQSYLSLICSLSLRSRRLTSQFYSDNVGEAGVSSWLKTRHRDVIDKSAETISLTAVTLVEYFRDFFRLTASKLLLGSFAFFKVVNIPY